MVKFATKIRQSAASVSMHSKQIRQTFLDFFKERNHKIVPSAPMVIKNDPTLMFTNAGMNQFKDAFLGHQEAIWPRIADTQKCLRVSGKHNDLEDVGKDTYHHTMFEMLGNWSFGDYFKKEAIEWSWELLVDKFGLDKERLYATVFGGDEKEGLARDMESFDFWKQILPEERILFGSKKDNFWEMGDSGPCGPCTEIHYDMRPAEDVVGVPGSSLVNNDHPEVIEIWNNVFMEFNRLASGELVKLPAQHVDTGMGFERLCRAIQGKRSNYDSDVFTPLLDRIAQLTGLQYGVDEKTDIAFRVVADHIRAIAFAISDGQLPSNNKAGYVIRRILRRAVRYGFSFLGMKEPFIFELIDVLSGQFYDVFPDLTAQKDFIAKVVREEENGFLRTLDAGIKKLETYFEGKETGTIAGADAFELYDTFGFPLDLTSLIASENGWMVDEAGFEQAMTKQKERSRAASATEVGDWVELVPNASSAFVGYDVLEADTRMLKYRHVVQKGDAFTQIILEVNPFYAESGGQVGDIGSLTRKVGTTDFNLPIIDCKKENGQHLLITPLAEAEYLGAEVIWKASVDAQNRQSTNANHTSTHLLQAALKMHLGSHIEQKGSLVSPTELRFDFSHPAKVTKEELQKVVATIKQKIAANIPFTEVRYSKLEDAKAAGVTALFGEKYDSLVRQVIFDRGYSAELCGGTHVQSTAAIGQFIILSEGSVSTGVRRITAITGVEAERYIEAKLAELEQVSALLQATTTVETEVQKLLEQNASMAKRLKEAAEQQVAQFIAKVRAEGSDLFLAQLVAFDADQIKNISFSLGKKYPRAIVILGSAVADKPFISVYLGQQIAEAGSLDARVMIKELAKHIQGGGGGQAFYATAGGKNLAGLPDAINAAKQYAQHILQ